MDAAAVQLLEAVRPTVLAATWRALGGTRMSWAEANHHVAKHLADPDNLVCVLGVEALRTTLRLHASGNCATIELGPVALDAAMALLASDPEPHITEYLGADLPLISPPVVRHTYTLSGTVVAALRRAYEPARWTLPFLRLAITDPVGWDTEDYAYAFNALWACTADIPVAVVDLDCADAAADCGFGRVQLVQGPLGPFLDEALS